MKTVFFFVSLLTVVLASVIPISPEEREEARKALQNSDLFDGDMLGIEFDSERNAIVGKHYRWPNAVVPYVIDDTLTIFDFLLKDIQTAMDNYEKNTCVRFVKRKDEKDYIRITWGDGKSCSADVGRITGEQTVNLGSGCFYVGTIIHELGHALGFYHEQSRSDRDTYLFIYTENVLESDQFNFKKLLPHENILYNKFDYNSIMIYGNKSLSKNGKDTIVAKNGQKLLEPFDKQKMTDSDVERVKKMYDC